MVLMFMLKNVLFSIVLAVTLFTSAVKAQNNVWGGLARAQFDSTAGTLRIPCAVIEDESGNTMPGLAPAYALNLLLSSTEPGSERFRLVDPIAAFAEIPESCLDTITVLNDATTATFITNSTEIDTDAAVFTDRFYTLELQADLLADGPVEFSVISAESRLYRKPTFYGETFIGFIGPPPFGTKFVYDDAFLEAAWDVMQEGLVVFEPGRVVIDCFYEDPNNLLEVFELAGNNVRSMLKSTTTAADNGKQIFTTCTAFNRDINRLERSIQIYTWTIFL